MIYWTVSICRNICGIHTDGPWAPSERNNDIPPRRALILRHSIRNSHGCWSRSI